MLPTIDKSHMTLNSLPLTITTPKQFTKYENFVRKIKEYLLSRELDEAARCVREMGSSHYHHELLKRGVKIAMEKDGKDHKDDAATSALDAMAALFSFLVKNSIVSEYQVAKGISRLHKLIPDIKLDVPAAEAMLSEFEEMAKEGGCLPTSS